MKSEENDWPKFITKQSDQDKFICQVFNLKYVENAEGYRTKMSDGKRLYSKVFFNSKLTPLVQNYLDNDDKVIIKINLYRLFNKSIVIINTFAAYWNPRGEVLGNPIKLTMT